MASKGKDRMKLKKDEIEFNNKRIDLKRFAYDVIKYTGLKFHVPESCIALYQGSDNDYGYHDFFLVLCSEIIRYQITNRYQYHTTFCQHYKSNKLATSKLIGMLLQEVINKAIDEPSLTPLHKVEISLSVVCELFLYLYSKDMDLNPKQLGTTWFQCYLKINKKQFENAGGLEKMYRQGSKSKVDGMDAFIDKFIEDHCLPYVITASNRDLKEIYDEAIHERNRKAAESLAPKDCEEMKKILERVKAMGKRPPMCLNSKNGEAGAVKPPEPDEASLVNLSHDPRLGIIPHDEVMLHFFGPSIASPQKPPASTTEEPRRQRNLSYKERMKMKKSSPRARVDQGLEQLNLDSLRTKQSSKEMASFAVAEDTTQSYNLQGAKSETRVENENSSASQTGKSSLCSSMEQEPGQKSLDFNLLGAKPKTRVENRGSSASQTDKSSLSVEQGPGQKSLDFSLLGPKSETEVKNGESSASQTGKSSLCSRVEQGPEQKSLDFKLLEPKFETEEENGSSDFQTGKSCLCSIVEQGPLQLTFNLLGAKSDTEVENGGSSASKAGKSSLCSNGEQCSGLWSLDFNLLGTRSKTEVENESSASKAGKSCLCSGVEQGPLQLTFTLLGPETEVENGSSVLQTDNSRLCSSVEQRPAPFSLDFNLLGDESETEVENGSSALETSILNLCSNGKQGLGLLSSASSETKQSSQKKTNMLAVVDPTSQSHSDASHQDANKELKESSSQKKKGKRKSKKH